MATVNNKLDVTDLDYDQIKGNLKSFLSNQSTFSGYDFSGPFLNGLEISLADALHTISTFPGQFNIGKPYPNPFNSSIKIPIEVVKGVKVKIDVIDIRGRIVDTIIDRELSIGKHELEWNSNSHASGVYIIRTTLDKTSYNEKTLLLK